MLGVRVEGGTGAGSKRPKKDPPPRWRCNCIEFLHRPNVNGSLVINQQHHGWEKRCDHCGVHRP